MNYHCRACSSLLDHEVIDLGHQPPSNAYIKKEQLEQPEMTYPLKVFLCTKCWLMQIPEYANYKELFTSDYAYFSSVSSSWCKHAEKFVESAIQRLDLNEKSFVVELASNDGYLLKYMKNRNIPCMGIEPTHETAEAARLLGINTMEEFFTEDLAKDLRSETSQLKDGVDLLIANNVLAHVPDINDFIAGIAKILNSKGYASIEFPHVLKLIEDTQFDTIYHEHYSYLSLFNVKEIVESHGLIVADVETLQTHGGSLRVWITHKGVVESNQEVIRVLKLEKDSGLQNINTYKNFEHKAEHIKNNLLEFLIQSQKKNELVIGYGAAAKGNTLLNFAGVKKGLLPAVADQAESKQGKYLPGSHIPIITPNQIKDYNPSLLLVLPWNLINEISNDKNEYKLVTAIPKINYW